MLFSRADTCQSQRLCLAWIFVVGVASTISAEQQVRDTPPHSHRAVEANGEPILKRIPVSLERPRNVIVDRKGNLLCLDAATGTLVRIDSKAKETVVAKGLGEPTALCLDEQGRCYVTDYAAGGTQMGRVFRVSPDGKVTVIAKQLTGPKGIAVAKDGRVFIALHAENRIVVLENNGRLKKFARGISGPEALCLDAKGNVLATSSRDGSVIRFSPAGQADVLCRDLKGPTGLAISPEGDLVVTNFGGNRLTRVRPDGKTDDYLKVPRGTIGFCFDREGNMIVVNWDLKLVIHVRNQLLIPCPHCDKKIRVRIKPLTQRTKPRKAI